MLAYCRVSVRVHYIVRFLAYAGSEVERSEQLAGIL